jgi:hypothetical protein
MACLRTVERLADLLVAISPAVMLKIGVVRLMHFKTCDFPTSDLTSLELGQKERNDVCDMKSKMLQPKWDGIEWRWAALW